MTNIEQRNQQIHDELLADGCELETINWRGTISKLYWKDDVLQARSCASCGGQVKRWDAFIADKNRRGGLYSTCRSCKADYYKANADKIVERVAVYYEKNPWRNQFSTTSRNARRHNAIDELEYNELLEKVIDFYSRCALTGDKSDVTVDHVQSFSAGGANVAENIILIRGDLNSSKNNRNLFEWFHYSAKERFQLSQERFDRLISYLADVNGVSSFEYRRMIYEAHEETFICNHNYDFVYNLST